MLAKSVDNHLRISGLDMPGGVAYLLRAVRRLPMHRFRCPRYSRVIFCVIPRFSLRFFGFSLGAGAEVVGAESDLTMGPARQVSATERSRRTVVQSC